jgi:hypothetical protein
MFFTDSLTVWIYIKINSKAAQEGLYFQVLCIAIALLNLLSI